MKIFETKISRVSKNQTGQIYDLCKFYISIGRFEKIIFLLIIGAVMHWIYVKPNIHFLSNKPFQLRKSQENLDTEAKLGQRNTSQQI